MNLGVAETCTRSDCAFWDSGCAVEELGLHAFDPDVSADLLELRARLEAMGAGVSRAEFARRLGKTSSPNLIRRSRTRFEPFAPS